jgi:NodT family efflux transporter outer membrane factor (OMF) lipoprotein
MISSCAVGPDFKAPAAPDAARYTSEPLTQTAATPGVEGGEAQRFTAGGDIAADWWTLFHSQALDDLIMQALARNPDLKAAQAAVKAARETTLAARGAFRPSVSASASASRQLDAGSRFSLFTPQVSVAYVPDVFGLNRRTVESARAQEDAVRFQMIATDITLASNVAAAAIQEASLEAQVEATHRLIDLNTKSLETVQYQVAKGYAGQADVAAQQSQLAQTEAGLPPLLAALAQQRNLLAVLTGRFPGQGPQASFDLATLSLPQDLPVSLPAALVAQRPDVLQAQATLHAASAQVGIAAASRLPSFQLTADAGSNAAVIGQVFNAGTGFWSLGAAATAPLFQGGALLHQERAAKAAYTQAAEQYRGTVLTACQNVADTLAALDQDAQTLKASAAAEAAAAQSLAFSQQQWKAGYAGYLTVLAAEQAYQTARIAVIQARASRYLDTVALFQALGGGWWRRADLAKD